MSPKLKKTLMIAGGVLLALYSLFMLAMFIYACVRDANLPAFTLQRKLVTPMMVILMWVAILGTGLPAATLLLWTFKPPVLEEAEVAVAVEEVADEAEEETVVAVEGGEVEADESLPADHATPSA